ncbi:MAG TPA: electron transfer flavoprotein subunit beta [Cyanobacteria bacterium UBA8530]|nr:electron transfer flavoprotein subunit beta [Cyanobacteria bacterium UBA8530]
MALKIVVCIKQVPDTNQVRIDPRTGTLKREGVPSIINPEDKHALEEALCLKDIHGGEVVVLTMGPLQALSALRLAIAMGADRAILLSDRAFAGSDTMATSLTLAAAIKRLGKYSLVFAGRQAIDGDTAQVGPQLAEHLNIPQLTYAGEVEIEKNEITVKRLLEEGYEIASSPLPVLVTAVKELNHPRYPTGAGVFKSFRENRIETWGLAELGLDKDSLGLSGSPTQVHATFVPHNERTSEVHPHGEEAVRTLANKIIALI